MKKLAIALAALGASVAFAQPHGAHPVGGPGPGRGGGGHYGGHYRGPNVVVRAPAPVYVRPAPRPVYVRPAYRPHVWVRPSVWFYPRLPVGVVSVNVGPRGYYYGSGVFYAPAPNGYQVIAPPIGAVVTQLPPGATMEYINGYTYATANGSWFYWDPPQNAWVVVSAPY